ncbi:hypothetical protein E8E13_001292 [Curvularia kusanoi]|uniref:Hydrophobin n=1 Tax=Curvularia kusanoi TaxID=90978 RepID=A0A9P4W7F6_CURKU|nr:hypothetical protein E8E13_001292 [Curvularia kusanoi]
MQLTNILALLALTASGALAAPPVIVKKPAPAPKPVKPVPPPPPPPVINTQINTCSSGAPYCCAPTNSDGSGGSTCKLATTSCNSISICCNNAQNGEGVAAQFCSATNTLQQPVLFI